MRCLLISIVSLVFIFVSFGSASALDTHYSNKGGYDNTGGYNNQIPYKAFFNGHSPKAEKIKVQKTDRFGNVVQAEVQVNQTEENVEQKGLDVE